MPEYRVRVFGVIVKGSPLCVLEGNGSSTWASGSAEGEEPGMLRKSWGLPKSLLGVVTAPWRGHKPGTLQDLGYIIFLVKAGA